MGREFSTKVVFLVEGKDEKNFIESLLMHMEYNEELYMVVDGGGKDNLSNELRTLTKTSGFDGVRSLGIIRDADDNALGALQSVQTALFGAKLPAPNEPLTVAGDINELRTAIYIMPNGRSSSGNLESLCLQALRSSSSHVPITSCAEDYFNCISIPAGDKALVQVVFSAFERPVPNAGLAAKRGYIPFDSSVFDELKTFLAMLFE